MKSGVELIAAERQEQIEKHHRTIRKDAEQNPDSQLLLAAIATLLGDDSQFPAGWDLVAIQKICDKPIIERMAVAGAFVAAEIDRLNYVSALNKKP